MSRAGNPLNKGPEVSRGSVNGDLSSSRVLTEEQLLQKDRITADDVLRLAKATECMISYNIFVFRVYF